VSPGAPSANDFTLPWYKNPLRSNTTEVIPVATAFSAINLPTNLAFSILLACAD
jgi:hypothetical protein